MSSFVFQQIFFGTPEYDESYQLRYDILRKPIGRLFSIEDIEKEYLDYHLAIYDNVKYKIIGVLILSSLINDTYKMRQVAISGSYQRSGVGRELVRQSEVFCRKMNGKRIELHARKKISKFYDKLDYERSGDIFQEVGIDHLKYIKNL